MSCPKSEIKSIYEAVNVTFYLEIKTYKSVWRFGELFDRDVLYDLWVSYQKTWITSQVHSTTTTRFAPSLQANIPLIGLQSMHSKEG